MSNFKIGDIVTRKSYGGDVSFIITDIRNEGGEKIYALRGLMQRLLADAAETDLVKPSVREIHMRMHRHDVLVHRHVHKERMPRAIQVFNRYRSVPGKILHIDSSQDFMIKCRDHYSEAGIESIVFRADESEQPYVVRQLLERNKPDLLVLTGHDGIKKEDGPDSPDRYRNSKYFIQAVTEARKYEASKDKLCIFAGACQSYFEGIMGAGANFASSPGRILINALDPAIVSKKVATTDSRRTVTPQEVARLTISGSKGIGGINTKGHLTWS